MSFVRNKEEQDFVDNTLMKFVELFNDLNLMEKSLYLKLKYGTDDSSQIVFIRNGFSLGLTSLITEKYSSYITVDIASNTVVINNSIIDEMRKNNENDILIYEALLNVIA